MVVGVLRAKNIFDRYYVRLERDVGQKHGSKTKAFKAEQPDLAALPVKDFLTKEFVPVHIDNLAIRGISGVVGERFLGMLTAKDIFGMMRRKTPQNIKYVGLKELDIDEMEKSLIQKNILTQAQKLHVDECELTVYLKEHSRTGTRHKFSAHLRLHYPGGTLISTKAHDWNPRTATQEALHKMENELSHLYKRNVREQQSVRKL